MTGRATVVETGERDPLDAYWTPLACARECLREVEDVVREADPSWTPRRVLEPCVGGGAWVRACREVWPAAALDRCDLDPKAPGLALDLRKGEEPMVGDFLKLASPVHGPRHEYDAIVGNPPYKGDALAWFDRAILLAPVVALVLRATIVGSRERFGWWHENKPARVTVLTPRPLWEGPGARPTTDTVDSYLITWVHGRKADGINWRTWR